MKKISSDKRKIYICLIIIFSFIYLSFILTSGFWSDDYSLWYLKGILKASDTTVLDRALGMNSRHMAQGRFFPISSIFCETFAHLLPLKLYKLYLVLITIVCGLTCYRAVYKISSNEDFALFSTISSVVLFCMMHNYVHSVFLCFSGNPQVSLIFCFIALGSWVDWLRTGKTRSQITFFITFVLSLLTYEVAYTFIFVYLGIALIEKRNIRETIKATWKTVVVFLCVVTVYMYVKIVLATGSYSGVSVNMEDLGQIFHGLFVSITSALPFFSWFARGGVEKSLHGFTANLSISFILKWVLLIGIFISIVVLYYKATEKNPRKDASICSIELGFVALACIMFPACLMAVSQKYQTFGWGLGYIVIIYQYFGFGILFALLFYGLVRGFPKYKKIWYAAFLLYGICIITVNQNNSYYNITFMEESGHYGVITADYVDLVENFSKSDVLNELSETGDLVCTNTRELYSILNFSDYDIQPMDSYTETSGEVERIKLTTDFVIAGKSTFENLDMVEEPYIFYHTNAVQKQVTFPDNEGHARFITLESARANEKGYCWTKLEDAALNINSLKMWTTPEFSIGTDFIFTSDADPIYRECILNGFSGVESNFTWTDGKTAEILLNLTGMNEESDTITMLLGIDRAINDSQELNLYVNGELVHKSDSVKSGVIDCTFERSVDDHYLITFDLPHATTTEIDPRTLGIAVHSIGFYDVITQKEAAAFLDTFNKRNIPKYPIGTDLIFTADGDPAYRKCMVNGFSGAEPDFTWTDGKTAEMSLRLTGVGKKADTVTMHLNIDRAINGSQELNLYVNGERVYERDSVQSGTIKCTFNRSADDIYAIKFDLPNATPIETDPRTLGIAIYSIGFYH